jgi:hypothetical protein
MSALLTSLELFGEVAGTVTYRSFYRYNINILLAYHYLHQARVSTQRAFNSPSYQFAHRSVGGS